MLLDHLETVWASKRLGFGSKPPKSTFSLKTMIFEKSLKKAKSMSNSRAITLKPPEMDSMMDVRLQEKSWEGSKKAPSFSGGLNFQNHALKQLEHAKI